MPSLDLYKRMIGARTDGIARKLDADITVEDTWDSDIASRIGYFYDYDHDDYKTRLNDMHSCNDPKKIPVEIKYIEYSSQTFAKDAVTYHIQFKPSFKYWDKIKYYDEKFGNRYNATFPVGMFCDLPDERGCYNRWLCVGLANSNDLQFPTYEILRCDYIFDWISNGIKHRMAGVLRSQSSYNSGVWVDYKIEAVEDQQQFMLPMTRLTESIYYNLRMIIDNKVLTEPRAWHITKVNRIAHNGCVLATLAQDRFDQHKDYIELDDNGEVVAMWADYYATSVEPEEPITPTTTIHSEISYSGKTPEIKIGGSYKKYAVSFFNGDEPIDVEDNEWTFTYRHNEDDVAIDATELINVIIVDETTIKIKFIGDIDYLGGILNITNTSTTDITSTLEVYVNSL